jgi:hypothetical protein
MTKKHRQTSVRIANPRDERTYTSRKSADDLVSRGAATRDADGSIRLVDDLDRRRAIQSQILINRTEQSIVRDRGGVIFWNGCRPVEPGQQTEVLPGRVPQIPRPDQGVRFDRAA